MTPVTVKRGIGPVVLGLPHTGTFVPDRIAANLNDNGQKLADTDWHIDRLYDGLLEGVTTVRANFHRYVIDANRDPSGDIANETCPSIRCPGGGAIEVPTRGFDWVSRDNSCNPKTTASTAATNHGSK